MRRFKISVLLVLALLVSSVVLAQKPKIRILATGGTIAGVSASATSSAYGAGQVGVQTLIDAVPQIKDVANVSGEQIVNIGSQDMNDAVWLNLAKRINQLLNEEGYDGVLVTHGTDTMEEMGYVYNGKPVYLHKPMAKQGLQSEFDVKNLTALPKVGIVYGYANCSPLPMQAFVDAKYDGIVLAGVGDGNFYKDVFDVALKAVGNGINVVRASRVPFGPTNLNGEVDDAKYHFIASLNLNPQKARVLLMLALTKTKDWQKIQQYFAEY